MEPNPPRNPARSGERPLLVLGGGICGLAAAEEAGRHGVPVLLLEREPEVGGLLRTDRREGFSFDRGGHRFITAIPWVLDRVRAILGDRLIVRERKSYVLIDGTRIDYPLELGNLLRTLGPGKNVRAFLSYARGRVSLATSDERSLEDWLRRRFGPYLYRTVFEGYSRKLWGLHPSEISAEWAPERISIPSLGGFLRELFVPSRRPPRTYAREYLYPRRGIGEIPEAWLRAVGAGGGTVLTGTEVSSLRQDGDAWVVRYRHEGRTIVRAVRGVVSTIPLPSLVGLLGPEERRAAGVDDPSCAESPLSFRGLRFLDLGFRRPVPLDATWIYQPDPECRFTRIQIPAARSPEMVPEGCGSIQLEFPIAGTGSDVRGSTVDDDARALLEALGLSLGEPCLSFVTTEPCAYPIYRHGARERAREIRSRIEGLPGIVTVGRQGAFSYVFLDRALAEGVNGCRALLGAAALPEPRPTDGNRPLPIEARSLVGSGALADGPRDEVQRA